MSLTPEDLQKDFFCPLCHSNHFRLVVVQSSKTGTSVVVDGLFRCAGCSLVFTDPQAYTRLMRDTLVDMPHRRDRMPTREYPPDSETVKNFEPPGSNIVRRWLPDK
jgi:hypothetical protein